MHLSVSILLVASITLASAFGAVAACPPNSANEARRLELMAQVRRAPDEATARTLLNQLWGIWADAPDAHAQDLLDEGIDRRATFDLDKAIVAFEALIAYCPDYAEGYNQRAFALFIRQDYEPALEDLDRALALRPDHLGALTGRALARMALGQNREALRDLEAALELNPWLPERNLLPVLRDRLGAEDI